MKFVDLEKLKIISEHNYITKDIIIELNPSDTVFDIKNQTRSALEDIFNKTAIETLINITLNTKETIHSLDDADAFFTTAVNIIISVVLDSICVQPHKGRPRERRLDVPEKLKVANVSMSLLKKCVNTQTYFDRFNISIAWQNNDIDYHYNMLTPKGEQYDD